MPHASHVSVSVVVAVYNGAATLPELVERLHLTLDHITAALEIVLVNDGSRDGSWAVIEAIARRDSAVIGLDLMHNYGQHNALLAGIMRASHDVVVTMDDDLQHPPEELPKLLELIAEGHDVAYGKPSGRKHSTWRNLSSRLTKGALKVALGADMAEKSSAFRAFRAELKKGFAGFSDPRVSVDVLLSWSARSVVGVPVDHHARKEGRSGYNVRKLLGLTMSMMVGYSTVPLRIASGLGVLASGFGLLIFMFVVIQRLIQEAAIPGFAFIAAAVSLFAGLQLFTLGVIGEYLARVHFRTMGKPTFVVRSEISMKDTYKGKNS